MADAMQGVMSLPIGKGPAGADQSFLTPENSAVFEQLRQNFTPEQLNQELLTAGEEVDPQAVMQFKSMLRGMQLPPEVIDALGRIVDLALENPDRYPELRADLIKEGVPEDILPPEFDAAYFGAMNMALDEMSAAAGPAPQGFASGGAVGTMNPIAAGIASLGRNGDTMLAHITPSEARMLRRNGGSGTINPRTGLREFGFFSGIAKAVGGVFKGVTKAVSGAVKGVVGAVKSFAKSSVGKMVTAVALGFVLGPAAATYLGISSAAGVAAISGFIGGAGSTLLAGGNLKDALRSGAMSALTAGAIGGVTQGFNTPYAGPTTVSGQLESVGNMFKPAVTPEQAAQNAKLGVDQADLSGPDWANAPKINAANDIQAQQMKAVENATWEASQNPNSQLLTGDKVYESGLAKGPSWNAPRVDSTMQADAISRAQFPPPSADAGQGFIYKPSNYNLTGTSLSGNAGDASSGIYDTLANKASNALQGTKDIYNQYISPSAIQSRGATEAMAKVQGMFPGVTAEQIATAPANSIIGQAYANALPGTIATYGPAALATTAGIAALGGFKGEPAEKPETPELGSDLFARSPYQFMVPPGGVNTQYYGGVQGAQYGVPQMARGGIADLPSKFPRKNGPIDGPGTATSDSIPAMLSDGEFVFTAKAVRSLGNGSRRLGAKRMYAMMKALEGKAA